MKCRADTSVKCCAKITPVRALTASASDRPSHQVRQTHRAFGLGFLHTKMTYFENLADVRIRKLYYYTSCLPGVARVETDEIRNTLNAPPSPSFFLSHIPQPVLVSIQVCDRLNTPPSLSSHRHTSQPFTH